ncbi:MAG: acyltransferase family protein [Burkholderiales bacterium]|nr:acyltransferase family protein [Burkholderiales bacterium]
MNRLPYLDALRVFAFALLIPYHVGMYYVSWDWHVKSPHASALLEPFMRLSSPWRLGLLFFVGGVAAQLLWAKRGSLGLLKDRSYRLLLPLLVGMLVVVVPQAYFEVKTQAPSLLPGDGGYLDFWASYLRGARFCDADGCLTTPTWNHLWFLPYLWLYALAAPLLARLGRLPALRLPDWAWCLLPALPLVLARWFVFPHFPSTHDLVHDHYNHLQYAYLFALGWASRQALAEGLWQAAKRRRWPLLALALASWALLVAYYQTYANVAPPTHWRMAQRAVWALMAWWAIAAACGWMQHWFNRDLAWLRAASSAVFCLYVLHQSVIVVLTQALAPLALPWGLEALLLLVLTFALSLLGYQVLRRVPWVRQGFGIRA